MKDRQSIPVPCSTMVHTPSSSGSRIHSGAAIPLGTIPCTVFFFADKKENALLFGDTIITAHLDIRNPIDLRLHSIFSDESQASTIWEILTGDKLDNATALQTIYDEISLGELGEMRDGLNNEDAHGMMIAAGYDGILSDLGNEQAEYVVFRASQIEILSIDRPLSVGRNR